VSSDASRTVIMKLRNVMLPVLSACFHGHLQHWTGIRDDERHGGTGATPGMPFLFWGCCLLVMPGRIARRCVPRSSAGGLFLDEEGGVPRDAS
jgi:hypothetical protein